MMLFVFNIAALTEDALLIKGLRYVTTFDTVYVKNKLCTSELFISYAHYVFTAPSDTTPTQVTAETELPSEVYYNQGKAIK